MKTTLDLPESLVKEVKLRALHEGRKLKDQVAELLRAGLAASRDGRTAPKRTPAPRVKRDPKTGFPVIQCRHAATRGHELTPDRVAEILAGQEAEWARDSG